MSDSGIKVELPKGNATNAQLDVLEDALEADNTPFSAESIQVYLDAFMSNFGIKVEFPKGTATKAQLDVLKDALEADNTPFCAGSIQVSPDAFILFYGKQKDARRLDLSKATPEDLVDLEGICDAATFGRNSEDVLDESYRKAWKLDNTNFATLFNPARFGLIDIIRNGILEGHDYNRPVYAELYKLNVYGEGSFFKAHKDTPRGKNMFGSLVIIFPTAHTGGELVLRHDNEEWTVDPASAIQSDSTPLINYIAFFSDVEHEVLPVKSGCRVTITYNLYLLDTPPMNSSLSVNPMSREAHFEATLRQMLDRPEFLPGGGCLGFGLRHQYAIEKNLRVDKLLPYLKGMDAVVVKVCQDLALSPRLMMVYDYEEDTILMDRVVDFEGEPEDESPILALKETGGIILKQQGYGRSSNDVDELVDWVTEPSTNLNQSENAFLAYGNEASIEYLYGDLVLIVRIGAAGDRSSTWI